MGNAYPIKCRKCGYSKVIALGWGFRFGSLCNEYVKKMKNGDLGPDGKAFYVTYPNGQIYPEQAVARCVRCGNYDEVTDLTMYIPKEGKEIPDAGPYLHREYIDLYYEKYMDYPYKCSKCGGESKIYKAFEQKVIDGELRCPACGDILEIGLVLPYD